MAPWSALRSLGQSRLLALTVLAPFLGTLILFNEQMIDWLLLSPTLAGCWGTVTEEARAASRAITLSRLEITYFGLVFLGSGSFLFNVFCPIEIKRHSTVSEFIGDERPLVTAPRTGLLVTALAECYLRNCGIAERTGPRFLREMAYPREAALLFEAVFTEIAEGEVALDDGHSESSGRVDDPDHDLHVMRAMNGNIIPENVARRVAAQRRVDKAFWATFHAAAQAHVFDMLALRYMNLDRSRPALRLIISICYALGFALLFVPTIKTFINISGRVGGL
ncbi:MAG TPA: hypothetical protein VGN83_20395 [Falsiroseomonas sp.]|jgi:hypothetical protein|nr:hypothetical protein [Falsiroseomonas sp.]